MLLHDVLENGVHVVLRENRFAQAVAMQAWVGVGSLNEGPDERGMAHFIEHMLFKGTDRRAVGEIGATVEGCGGEINAFTTFDHTVFHLTLAAPHAAVGLDLLGDAFANSRFDPDEFEREREVILEEIRRGNDSPGARVGRRVFELVFAGSEAGRPIIGSEAGLKEFSRDSLYRFYRRWYVPENLTLVVVGDFDGIDTMERIRAAFGSLPRGGKPLPAPPVIQTVRPTAPVVTIIRGDFQQPRVELVFPAPPLEHFDSTALDLAAFALGSGEMSRLSRRLRDADASVTSVGASVYSPLFGGLFELSAVAGPELIGDAVAGLAREIQRLRTQEPVTGEELARARANLKADRIFQEETVDGQARTLGFGMRTPQRLLYDDVYTALINAMPESAVAGAVNRWLRPETATIVVLVHDDHPLTEAEVLAAFNRGLAEGRQGAQGGQSAVRRRASGNGKEGAAAEVVRLKPGVTVIYRHNPNVELFTLTAATEGGLRGETAATAGLTNAVASMLATASEHHSYTELMGQVEGLGASLEGFSGKDSLGFHLQCLTEHTETMLGLFRECLLTPVFPEEQWTALAREFHQSLQAQSDSPAGIAVRRFQERIFGDHPYRFPLIGTEESLAGLNPEVLARAAKELLPGGPWVLAVASTRPAAEVLRLLGAALEGFNPKAARRPFASDRLTGKIEPGSIRVAKDREQSHVVYGFPGVTWDDPDRAALDVLVNVLGGHGGRLFRTLRDRDSLAYTVSPLISYGCHPGVVGSYIACAPDKADRALAALKAEMMALTVTPPSPAEMDRARNFIVGTHDMSLQKSDSQTSTMALMELYGYGFDDFLKYPKAILAVREADVSRVARRLLIPQKAVEVVVGPG